MWKSLSENGSNYPPPSLLSSVHSSKLPATVRGACGVVSLHCAGLGGLSRISRVLLSPDLPCPPSCFYTPLLAEADIFSGNLKQVRGVDIEVLEEETTENCTESNPAFLLLLPHPVSRLNHVTMTRSGCCAGV